MAGMLFFSRLVLRTSPLLAAFIAPHAAFAAPALSAVSPLPLEDAAIAYELAAADQGFQVSAFHDLSGEYMKAGFGLSPTLTLELSHPGMTAALLKADPQAAIVLPLRVSLHTNGGKTHLTVPSPSVLLAVCGLSAPASGEAEAMDRMLAGASSAFESVKALTADHFWRAAMRSYRLALVGTGTGQEEMARKSAAAASARWKRFMALTQAPSGDSAWLTDAGTVQHLLDEASALVQSGKGAEAHEVLEGVRAAWLKMRSRNGQHPLEDKVTLYHDQMEAFLGSLGGQKAEENLRLLKESLNQILAHKSDRRTAPLQRSFDDLSLGLVNSVKAAEAAMKGGNPAALKELGGTMKPPFIKFYLNFG